MTPGFCERCGRLVEFVDGQRVHVGAQANHLAGLLLATAHHADHAGLAEPCDDLVDPEAPELLGDKPGGTVHVVEHLGMAVDVTAPLGHHGFQGCDTVG